MSGLGRTQNSQLVHPAGCRDGRQEIRKELLVSLAVEDHHRNPVRVFGGPNHAEQVLRDDVLEEGGLARTGCAEHDRLHHARRIGPEPGLSVDVIA